MKINIFALPGLTAFASAKAGEYNRTSAEDTVIGWPGSEVREGANDHPLKHRKR